MNFKIASIFITFFFMTSSNLFCQIYSGVVTYEGNLNKSYKDSFLTALNSKEKVSMATKQRIINSHNNATPDIFILNFKDQESFYYHQPTLESDDVRNVGSKAGKNSFYTNLQKKQLIENSPSLGYIKRIDINWTITKETKKIGDYQCFKAIASEKLYSRSGFYFSKKVEAWFAPELPAHYGPKRYGGLPGLILKIVRDKFTLRAIEINLNPEENVKITRPNKNSQIISEKESHKRIAEQMEELKKRYKNN